MAYTLTGVRGNYDDVIHEEAIMTNDKTDKIRNIKCPKISLICHNPFDNSDLFPHQMSTLERLAPTNRLPPNLVLSLWFASFTI